MGLTPDIGAGPVAVDTAVFIYLIEEHAVFLPAALSLFARAERGEVEIVTSAVTLLEVLVVPRRLGDERLAGRYEEIFTRSRGIHLVEMDMVQLRTAAQLRALYGLRTPDALQLAAALTTRCSMLITNDRRFPTVPGLNIVQLAGLCPAGWDHRGLRL